MQDTILRKLSFEDEGSQYSPVLNRFISITPMHIHRDQHRLLNLDWPIFAILKMFVDEDNGKMMSTTVPGVPSGATNLEEYLSPQGEKTREFMHYKRALTFIRIFNDFMEYQGKDLLIHLNLISFKNIIFVEKDGEIDLHQGIHMVFPTANQVPSAADMELVGDDILLTEFLNLTRFIYEFRCTHHLNNFYNLMVITMKTHHNVYSWRKEVFQEMRDLLNKQAIKAEVYESQFEHIQHKCMSTYFTDSHLSHRYVHTPVAEVIYNRASPASLPRVHVSRLETVVVGIWHVT